MERVLIIGSKGMAGHMIYNYFKENTKFVLIDVARNSDFHVPTHKLDVTDFEALKKVFKETSPSIVINCIGILNKDAEDHPDRAVLLNTYLPHFLAQCGNEFDFKLIHISTDCVFNGKKGGYTEFSEKDGVGFYAQTKALGEVVYKNHLTLRTSIIGPELNANGIGLFHWFMQQKGAIKGYQQAYWTGITTLELAKAIIEAIKQDIAGLHHLVNDVKISKFELTNMFKATFKRNFVEIEPTGDYKVDKSLVKTDSSFIYTVPRYEEMIEDMSEWIKNHSTFYKYDL